MPLRSRPAAATWARCGLRDIGESTGEISYELASQQRGQGYATRAVRLAVEYAFAELGLGRVQARVATGNAAAVRVARRAGLRNEGVVRVALDLGTDDYALLARLRDDPSPTEHGGFRALLNSFLPRKRVIAQMLVRDDAGRVLLCHPTYKDDWDLPGGVVEVRESPREAAGREVLEELALRLPVGRLVLTDWMPPWGGWDDALCLVFDGGVHAASLVDGGGAAVSGDPRGRVLLGGARSRHAPPTTPPVGSWRPSRPSTTTTVDRPSRSPVEPPEPTVRLTMM